MNKKLEAKLKTLPAKPGVYFHKSARGEIIYVGKAAILKNRVRQYFQSSRLFDAKTMALVGEIEDTDWVETESEIDALFLESEMVKRYMPRYNVLLRDDKSQMFVRITMGDEWPVLGFTRNPLDDGAEYFGPFYNGRALRKALRYLRRVYPYFVKMPDPKGSKLEMQIGLNPDVREGSGAYKANLRKLISYIKGNRKALMRELESEMKTAAKNQEFEQAASLRNKLYSLKELQRRVMFGDHEFLDISKDRALSDLAYLLGIDGVLKRIEGYDISHQGGQNVVASMVVFTNGASDRSEYRKFKTKQQTNNDTGNIYETLLRRFSEKNKKAWPRPDLILIDGGKGQLAAAIRALQERQVTLPCISVAKREEEIIVAPNSDVTIKDAPNGEYSVHLDGEYLVINLHPGQFNAGSHSKNLHAAQTNYRYGDITKLIQRIRDESHRFAISYHTVLKRSAAMKSPLEAVYGLGPVKRRQLLKKFGSLRGLRQASEGEIADVVGAKLAQLVVDAISSI